VVNLIRLPTTWRLYWNALIRDIQYRNQVLISHLNEDDFQHVSRAIAINKQRRWADQAGDDPNFEFEDWVIRGALAVANDPGYQEFLQACWDSGPIKAYWELITYLGEAPVYVIVQLERFIYQ